MPVERETPLEFMESQVFGLEMTEEQILAEAKKKKRGTGKRFFSIPLRRFSQNLFPVSLVIIPPMLKSLLGVFSLPFIDIS